MVPSPSSHDVTDPLLSFALCYPACPGRNRSASHSQVGNLLMAEAVPRKGVSLSNESVALAPFPRSAELICSL